MSLNDDWITVHDQYSSEGPCCDTFSCIHTDIYDASFVLMCVKDTL